MLPETFSCGPATTSTATQAGIGDERCYWLRRSLILGARVVMPAPLSHPDRVISGETSRGRLTEGSFGAMGLAWRGKMKKSRRYAQMSWNRVSWHELGVGFGRGPGRSLFQ
jgi:hypothetical protein